MFHRVNANVLDKKRRELAQKRPLWTGDVDNASQAIEAARELLGPIFKGDTRADSIVLHILPEKGGALTSTEYAEDFLSGKGASLGDSLLAKGADHGLTPEEVEREQARRTSEALKAMMPTLKAADQRMRESVNGSDALKEMIEDQERKTYRLDPMEGNIQDWPMLGDSLRDDDGKMPKEILRGPSHGHPLNSRRPTPEELEAYGLKGANPSDYYIQTLEPQVDLDVIWNDAASNPLEDFKKTCEKLKAASSNKDIRDMVKRVADKQDVARGFNPFPRSMHGQLNPQDGFAQGGIVDSLSQANRDMLRATGRGADKFILSPEAYEMLKREIAPGVQGATEVIIEGIPVRVSNQPHSPAIQVVQKARNLGPGRISIDVGDGFRDFGEVKEFNVTLDAHPLSGKPWTNRTYEQFYLGRRPK